jgi:hypothetical protein
MNNELVNQALRKYVQTHLTPTEEERNLISSIYAAVCLVLGRDKCLQIGSYPRFTAIRPPHDLDVLFILGKWDKTEPRPPLNALSRLKAQLETELKPPQGFSSSVKLQTHSITIQFIRNGEEVFAVDVVPALITEAKNEFGDDIYLVPEIIGLGHQRRLKKYQRVEEHIDRIEWILTDPRGYISVASEINKLNTDFRKSVKLPKKWKCVSKERNDEFKLKSFHIEQIVTSYFRKDSSLTVFDAVTKFFEELPMWLEKSQIPDRANLRKNIDAYVDELTITQKAIILNSRDEFLEKLKSYDGEQETQILFKEKSAAVQIKSVSVGTTATSATSTISTISEVRRVIPRSNFGD